eukprot:scaffold259773_cov30-Tisochrysis_lutea.AAC.1
MAPAGRRGVFRGIRAAAPDLSFSSSPPSQQLHPLKPVADLLLRLLSRGASVARSGRSASWTDSTGGLPP